jgi:uncharacterized protein
MKFLLFLLFVFFLQSVAHAENIAPINYCPGGDPIATTTGLAKTEEQKRDQRKALETWKEKANNGDVRTQYFLGSIYENGKGFPVENSLEEAAKWYQMGAEQGDLGAQEKMGGMYKKGNGVKQSAEEAVKWFRKAADQGGRAGQCELGQMYLRGEGIKQDYAEAYFWMSLVQIHSPTTTPQDLAIAAAAEHLSPQQIDELQKRVATWTPTSAKTVDQLQNGYGSYNKGDYQAAIGLWQPLAERGNAEAQGWLGWMYWWGRGVKQNYAESAKWFLKAAEQDDSYAQSQISMMYRGAYGVKRDYQESYFWLLVARMHKAVTENQVASVGSLLTPDEKASVDKRAQEWCSTHCRTPVPYKTAFKPNLTHP